MGDSFWGALNCCNPGNGKGISDRPGYGADVMNNRQGVLPHLISTLSNPPVVLVSLLAFFSPPVGPQAGARTQGTSLKQSGERNASPLSPLSLRDKQPGRNRWHQQSSVSTRPRVSGQREAWTVPARGNSVYFVLKAENLPRDASRTPLPSGTSGLWQNWNLERHRTLTARRHRAGGRGWAGAETCARGGWAGELRGGLLPGGRPGGGLETGAHQIRPPTTCFQNI